VPDLAGRQSGELPPSRRIRLTHPYNSVHGQHPVEAHDEAGAYYLHGEARGEHAEPPGPARRHLDIELALDQLDLAFPRQYPELAAGAVSDVRPSGLERARPRIAQRQRQAPRRSRLALVRRAGTLTARASAMVADQD